MIIILTILATLYVCVGVMMYIIGKILNEFENSVGSAFGWSVNKPSMWCVILHLFITVLFWPILLIIHK